MTAAWLALSACLAFGQESAPSESRPDSAPAADDPADVARVCELYDEARAAVEEGDFKSAAELTAEADAERARRLRGDHPRVVDSLVRLASGNLAAGRAIDALPLFESVRAIRERLHEGDHPDVAAGLNRVGVCLFSLGRAAEALSAFESAHAMSERLHRGDHPNVATALINVALGLDALGRTAEALSRLESALEIRRRCYEGDHPDVADSLSRIAVCLHEAGRSAEALPRFEAATEMRRRLFKGDHPSMAESLYNLASCLDSLGRSAEALPRHEEALTMRQSLFSGAHPDVADSLSNLAVCLDALGRRREALLRHEASLAMRRRLAGGDHPSVAVGLSNLAECLRALGRPAEALARHEEALAMRRALFKGDHAAVAWSLTRVANCLLALSRWDEALPVYEAALAMRRSLFGGDHPDLATSLNNVAACLDALGRPAEALPLHEASLAMRRRLHDGDHADFAASLSNAAYCLDALGRSAEALPLHEAGLTMRRRLYGEDHADVAVSLAGLAGCLHALGRRAEALSRLEAVLAMRRRLFGPVHPDVAISMSHYAECLKDLGRTAEALPLFEAARAMHGKPFDGDRAEVAGVTNNAAVCLDALGRTAEALRLFETALEMRRRLYKGDHPDVATSLNNVAVGLAAVGRTAAALPSYEAARAMQERLFKGDHPDLATTTSNLAHTLAELGRTTEAQVHHEAALKIWTRFYKGDHPLVAYGLNAVACGLHAQGRFDEALPQFEAALGMARRGRFQFAGSVPRSMAKTLAATGELRKSADLLIEAAELYEARRRDVLRLAERERGAYEKELRGREIYRDLCDVRTRLGEIGAASEALERGRGRAASDLMARARLDPLTEARRRAAEAGDAARVASIDAAGAAMSAAEGEVIRWNAAEAALFARRDLDPAGRAADLTRISESAAAARRALHAAEAERARLIAGVLPLGKPATADAMRSLVAGRERLLEYAVGERTSRLFVVRPDVKDPEVLELTWPDGAPVTEESLSAAVASYRRALIEEGAAAAVRGIDETAAPDSAPTGSATELGRRLFTALMPAKLWEEVRSAGRVELMADGALHQLPFEALIAEPGRTAKERKYWLDVGPQIVYAASGSTSLEARRLRSTQGAAEPEFAVLAVGDPVYATTDAPASRATPPAQGALVVRAPDGSVGAALGVRRGDVITGYGATAIADAKQLAEAEGAAAHAAEAASEASTVELTIWRVDGAVRIAVPPGPLGVEVATEPPSAAWAKLVGGDEAAVAVVERGGLFGRYGALKPLPGTRREVESIEKTVAGPRDARGASRKVKTLLGSDATVTRVFAEAPKARILHFATHYLAEETDDASFSALALTAPALPSRDDDGFLRIRDVIERWRDRLSATELVVLSACESKGGRGVQEDSINAMPIALLYAGVPSVVSSLWRVEDQSTADLMSDFYRRLFDPAANAATADRPAPTRLEHFTAARKAARARRPEPYFWAPFVWMGDPR